MLDNKLTKGINEVQLRVSKSTRGLQCQLYCEDRRLSLPRDGMYFKTIMLKDVDREVFQFDNESLMSFLDLCACFMNIENGPTSGPAASRIKTHIQPSEQRITPCWQLSLSTTCNISTSGDSDSYYEKAATSNSFCTFATYGALRIATRVKTQATPDVTGGSHSAGSGDPYLLQRRQPHIVRVSRQNPH